MIFLIGKYKMLFYVQFYAENKTRWVGNFDGLWQFYAKSTFLSIENVPNDNMKIYNLDLDRSALVKPILVNVGRAGAASMNIIQEVEFVQPEAKIVYILGK